MTNCAGGRCTHHAREHWCLWRVLRGTVKTNRAGGCVAVRAKFGTFGRSGHARAQLIHRTKRVATVWENGRLIMVGARWLCGSESCGARAVPTGVEDGYRRCGTCDVVAERTLLDGEAT